MAMADREPRVAMADREPQVAMVDPGIRTAMVDRELRVAIAAPGTRTAMVNRELRVAMTDLERKVRMFIDNNNGMDMDDEQELESGVQLTRSDGLLRRGVCLNSVR